MQKELHSEMEKVVLMNELPENWTYPLIQPKLIENKREPKIILTYIDGQIYTIGNQYIDYLHKED